MTTYTPEYAADCTAASRDHFVRAFELIHSADARDIGHAADILTSRGNSVRATDKAYSIANHIRAGWRNMQEAARAQVELTNA